MQSYQLICIVCSKPDPLCSENLGVPICSSCWKESLPKKTNFYYDAEIDKITDKIYLGNEEAQKRPHILKAIGVTNIIVVGTGLPVHHPKDFIYKSIEIDDFYQENIAFFFDETYKFIEESKGSVYVHCAAGVSRSPTIVIAYIMKKNRKNYEETYEFVREKRPCISPNMGFVKQLKEFEKTLELK